MKKLITVLSSIILFFGLIFLVLAFTTKKIIVSTLTDSMVTKEVSNQVTNVIYEYAPDAITDEVLTRIEEEIATNPEVQSIVNKYFDGIVESIVNNTDVEVPDTKEELEKLINDNVDLLNEMNVTLTEEQKNEIVNELEDSKVIETVYKTVSYSVKKGLTEEQKTAIGIYSFITSNTFKYIICGVILALLLVVCLVKKSIYKWMINVSPSLIIIGLGILFVLPMLIDKIGGMLTNKLIGKTADININVLTNWGIAYLVLGVILTVGYIIIKNVKKED